MLKINVMTMMTSTLHLSLYSVDINRNAILYNYYAKCKLQTGTVSPPIEALQSRRRLVQTMALFWCLEVLSLIAVSLSAETNMLSSTGVPCYLHPAAAGCHYNLKPGSETCTTPGERMRLNQAILVVNRTLVSLEQQLIRLGISKKK